MALRWVADEMVHDARVLLLVDARLGDLGVAHADDLLQALITGRPAEVLAAFLLNVRTPGVRVLFLSAAAAARK